jgi:hypothetical protein
VSYAHELIVGQRKPPLPMALQIYDATSLKLGPLEGLTKREIELARKLTVPKQAKAA